MTTVGMTKAVPGRAATLRLTRAGMTKSFADNLRALFSHRGSSCEEMSSISRWLPSKQQEEFVGRAPPLI